MQGTKVIDTVLDPETLLPKKVVRTVVAIKSDEHESGFRFGYQDEMIEGYHELYTGDTSAAQGEAAASAKAASDAVNQVSIDNAKAAQPTHSGWGKNA